MTAMTAVSARSNRGVKRLAVALVAAFLLTLTACAPELPEPAAPRILREPTSVTAVAGDGEATVSWVAPATNPYLEDINGYTVTASDGQTATVMNSLRLTMTGLTNGTVYTFTVTAYNTSGEGERSEPSNEVTPGPQ